MADRCIKWERPYASTGQGHPVRDRSGSARPSTPSRSALAYDPEKDTSSGFDNAYTAEVGERDDWGERMWYRTLWKETGNRDDAMLGPWRHPRPLGPTESDARQERSTYCPETVATDRSCRRALDRDVAANPPRITLPRLLDVGFLHPRLRAEARDMPQRWYDKIAPAGPWECVEYEDE